MVKYVFITVANLLFIVAAANQLGLRVNTTASYPSGIYRLSDSRWGRADLVEACLPAHIATYAIERGYMENQGRCDQHPSVIKTVYGLGGDWIEVGENVMINAQPVAGSELQRVDSKSRELNRASSQQLATDEVWLMSVHSPLSFDSRYFGAIPEHFVLGKLEPVWLFGKTTK